MNRSPRRPRTAIALAALLGGALFLSGCSGDTSADSSDIASASAMPSGAMTDGASAMGDGTLIGADPSTWAPLLIKRGESALDMVVGQVAIAPKFRYAKQSFAVESSDASVASVSTADTGQVVALQAVGPGTATVTIYRGSGKANGGKGKILATVEVTVSER
jgi:ferric-dicitrate binding protein FerR (iron transport regulator)